MRRDQESRLRRIPSLEYPYGMQRGGNAQGPKPHQPMLSLLEDLSSRMQELFTSSGMMATA